MAYAAILFRTVETHWPRFVEQAEEAGGLPRFVMREVEEYLRCGRLEHGCLLLACCRCGFERLVGFFRKRRGFFPSCLGRRFVQRFDSALRLNVHAHTLAVDGVYLRADDGELVFHALGEPSRDEVAEVARRTGLRVGRILERHGRALDGLFEGGDYSPPCAWCDPTSDAMPSRSPRCSASTSTPGSRSMAATENASSASAAISPGRPSRRSA